MRAIFLVALMFATTPAFGNDLPGNWKLVSFQTIYADDPAPKDMYGAAPKGVLSMSKEGRMIAIITGEGRKSGNEAWNGSEQKRKYKIEGDRLIIDSAPGPSVLFPNRTAFARLVWERDK